MNGPQYSIDDIWKIVRLQKRVKDFLDRRRAVKFYCSICPPELTDLDTENVKIMLSRYGPFVYLSEEEELEMGF